MGTTKHGKINKLARRCWRTFVAFCKWLIDRLRAEPTRRWLRSKAVAAWMNVLIAAAAAITVVTAGLLAEQHWPAASTWGTGALKLFALWCLAFLPGWLYIRFLTMRAKALWIEYVLTLHRLGWDLPSNLPEPPVESEFHDRWSAGGPRRGSTSNIYRLKFEAFYGRQVLTQPKPRAEIGVRRKDRPRGRRVSREDFVVRTESLFPLFLATAVFAAGWCAVLWDTTFLTAAGGVWDALKYGFLGAYAFVVSMLIRRFFQSDLRPSAYATSVFRVILVLLLVAVLYQVLPTSSPTMERGQLAFAFLVGFFPLVGLQVIQRIVSKLFGAVVPSLTSDYPLDQLDGFNIWYEARLAEEGVEDMQNLTTMNLVDVVLHTRVPPGRLVDWIDQAFLLIHLDPATRVGLKRMRKGKQPSDFIPGALDRVSLRRAGIRTATDLLKAFSVPEERRGVGTSERRLELSGLTRLPLEENQIRLLVKVLCNEPGLATVWNLSLIHI